MYRKSILCSTVRYYFEIMIQELQNYNSILEKMLWFVILYFQKLCQSNCDMCCMQLLVVAICYSLYDTCHQLLYSKALLVHLQYVFN